MTLSANSTNKFGPSPFIVGMSLGDGVNYTSIQAAINDAAVATSPPQTVLIRPGTYIEDFTLADFVNVVGVTTPSGGLEGLASSVVLIDGTITGPPGSSTIQNLRINTTVGSSIVQNTPGSIITIVGCTVLSTTFCLQMIDGNANIDSCYLSAGVNAIEYDTNSGPVVRAHNSRMDSASSAIKIDTSSTFFAKNCQFINGAVNCLEATILGINVEFVNCQLISNGGTAIDVSGGGSLSVNFCEVNAPGGSAIEFGAGGCAGRSYFNKYNVGAANYITGTVGSYDYANDAVDPASRGGIDSGIVVTNLGSPPFRQNITGLTTTVGAVSNTIITMDLGTTPGTYVMKVEGTAYDSTAPAGFGTLQAVAVRTDGVTATFITNSSLLNGGDGVLVAAGISLSTAGNNLVIDADGTVGATANWRCVVSEILFQG